MPLFIKKETGGKLMDKIIKWQDSTLYKYEKRTVINKKKNAITPNKEEKQ